jgi:hypothetical protein
MRNAPSFSTLTTATALRAYAAVAILNFGDIDNAAGYGCYFLVYSILLRVRRSVLCFLGFRLLVSHLSLPVSCSVT